MFMFISRSVLAKSVRALGPSIDTDVYCTNVVVGVAVGVIEFTMEPIQLICCTHFKCTRHDCYNLIM